MLLRVEELCVIAMTFELPTWGQFSGASQTPQKDLKSHMTSVCPCRMLQCVGEFLQQQKKKARWEKMFWIVTQGHCSSSRLGGFKIFGCVALLCFKSFTRLGRRLALHLSMKFGFLSVLQAGIREITEICYVMMSWQWTLWHPTWKLLMQAQTHTYTSCVISVMIILTLPSPALFICCYSNVTIWLTHVSFHMAAHRSGLQAFQLGCSLWAGWDGEGAARVSPPAPLQRPHASWRLQAQTAGDEDRCCRPTPQPSPRQRPQQRPRQWWVQHVWKLLSFCACHSVLHVFLMNYLNCNYSSATLEQMIIKFKLQCKTIKYSVWIFLNFKKNVKKKKYSNF